MVGYSGKNGQNKAGMISILSLCLIIVGLLFVLFSAIMGYNNTIWYGLVVVLWVVLYLVLADLMEPYYFGVFNSMTKAQGKNYLWYVAVDMIDMICLSIFVVNSANFSDKFHYIFLVLFIILLIPKYILYHSAVKNPVKKSELLFAKKEDEPEYGTIKSSKDKNKPSSMRTFEQRSSKKYDPTSGGKASEDKRIKMITLETFDEPKLVVDRFEAKEEETKEEENKVEN